MVWEKDDLEVDGVQGRESDFLLCMGCRVLN